LRDEELLGEGPRDIALVRKELAKEPLDQAWNRFAVVEIASGEAEGAQLPAIIHHQVQFEAIEPPHRSLPSTCIDRIDAVLVDPRRLADSEGGRVDEANAGAWPTMHMQVDGRGYQVARQEVDKAYVAHELRGRTAQLDLDMLAIEAFEGPTSRLMKKEENRQDLGWVEPRRSSTSALSGCKRLMLPQRLKALRKRLHRAVQGEDYSYRCPSAG
jgi:hypothetical protein